MQIRSRLDKWKQLNLYETEFAADSSHHQRVSTTFSTSHIMERSWRVSQLQSRLRGGETMGGQQRGHTFSSLLQFLRRFCRHRHGNALHLWQHFRLKNCAHRIWSVPWISPSKASHGVPCVMIDVSDPSSNLSGTWTHVLAWLRGQSCQNYGATTLLVSQTPINHISLSLYPYPTL